MIQPQTSEKTSRPTGRTQPLRLSSVCAEGCVMWSSPGRGPRVTSIVTMLTMERMDLDVLLARVPEGWSVVSYLGRPYGLTRTDRVDGRSVTIYAEELGGSDVDQRQHLPWLERRHAPVMRDARCEGARFPPHLDSDACPEPEPRRH